LNLQTIRRWAPWLALVVLFAIATSLLSWWQFSRREERVEKINQVIANYESTPVSLAEVSWVETGNGLRADEWRPLILKGNYLPEHAILVRNRPLSGSPGFLQLVPFRADSGEVVVVERGWLPAGSDITEPLLNPIPDSGEKELVVRLRAGESDSGKASVPGRLDTIDLAEYAALHPELNLETKFYGRLSSETPSASEAPIPQPKPSLDEGNHLSYALQWLLFGIMAFGAFFWAYRNDKRLRLEEQGKIPKRVQKRTQASDDAAFEDQNQ
jgi:cytochrome oxidase assembly protein ShyY1